MDISTILFVGASALSILTHHANAEESAAFAVANKFSEAFVNADAAKVVEMLDSRQLELEGDRQTLVRRYAASMLLPSKRPNYVETLGQPRIVRGAAGTAYIFPVARLLRGMHGQWSLEDRYVVLTRDAGQTWSVIHSGCLAEADLPSTLLAR
jgi:hypothetical protein